jgi:hypothetical protein
MAVDELSLAARENLGAAPSSSKGPAVTARLRELCSALTEQFAPDIAKGYRDADEGPDQFRISRALQGLVGVCPDWEKHRKGLRRKKTKKAAKPPKEKRRPQQPNAKAPSERQRVRASPSAPSLAPSPGPLYFVSPVASAGHVTRRRCEQATRSPYLKDPSGVLRDATTGDYTLPPPKRALTDEEMLRTLKEKDQAQAKHATSADGSKRKPKWPMTGLEHYQEQQRILGELELEREDVANGRPSRTSSAMQGLVNGVKGQAQQMVNEHNQRVREL